MSIYNEWSLYYNFHSELEAFPYVRNIGGNYITTDLFHELGRKRVDTNHVVLQYTLKGTIFFKDSKGEYPVPEGKAFLTETRDPEMEFYYSEKCSKPYICIFFCMSGGAYNLCRELVKTYGRIYSLPLNSPCLKPALDNWNDSFNSKFRNIPFAEAVAMAQNLFYSIINFKKSPQNLDLNDRMIYEARNIIIANQEKPLNVAKIASELSITPGHLARIFKQKSISTPKTFIDSVKIERACDLLLNSKMSIKEIADAFGYDTASNFTRTFKRIKGVSPIKFRQD